MSNFRIIGAFEVSVDVADKGSLTAEQFKSASYIKSVRYYSMYNNRKRRMFFQCYRYLFNSVFLVKSVEFYMPHSILMSEVI